MYILILYSTSHSEDQISLSEVSEFSSLFPTAPSPVPTLVEQQTIMELDQLTEQETRDLLISVLFVLKYIDRGTVLTLCIVYVWSIRVPPVILKARHQPTLYICKWLCLLLRLGLPEQAMVNFHDQYLI